MLRSDWRLKLRSECFVSHFTEPYCCLKEIAVWPHCEMYVNVCESLESPGTWEGYVCHYRNDH
ncbi:hypothetical protein GCM10007901_24820 [Dyella acidisoli]|uniref:Uncharacterized protein n=1 Tax=Dyella acidisoli TaxID=1867834 RepID=A0ABQ5XSN2_9GAMM|nr:hypothetical protein GCM10007901_24820 [Dyella acidisoli]